MFYFKYIFFFILFFSFHYVEGLPPIGSLSVAQVTKIPILLLFFVYLFFNRKRKLTSFEKCGYLYSFEPIFCPASIAQPLQVLIFSIKQLPLILSYNFWLSAFYKLPHKLEIILYSLAQYISLTSLLTLLNIVRPLQDYKSAESFAEGLDYYSSIFGAPHAASSYFAISAIILLFGLKSGRFSTLKVKVFNICLILISIYSVYLSFIRTGWLMLIVSVVVLFIQDINKFATKYIFRFIVLISIIGSLSVYLYNNNDLFRMRISGENRYREASGVIDIGGSGRTSFWEVGLENWTNNNFYGMLFGKGYDQVTKDNERELGLNVFNHNQFLDSLTQYGLFSLLFFVLYYFYLFQFIRKKDNNNKYKKISFCVYASSLIFCFFQNELYFDYAVLFSILLALLYIEEKNLYNNVSIIET